MTKQAKQLLKAIKDRREQSLIFKRLEKLKSEPEKQGKALTNELKGYRSIRAVGQRYRIVYQINDQNITVIIVAIGRRKQGDKNDVYEVMRSLLSEISQEEE
ncbi:MULTISPECIES: type II toxin-antitoxin system RelE family toxin [Crocosphaera]|uniref:type II toxin-antitoxin system RelE family toxin n=1 Tax=Crocosphaera TaxID=263510 RepID=UPI001E430F1A|nr:MULTISPECIES: type II toxin-antitoxin system mRNA interferase toxin, RelE/StbE family [Crocosphaera]MCH2243455.1 type II toxin-antitoxin system mRNA interferase toxin, RelE/StbE family [Crocosphaera sp.]